MKKSDPLIPFLISIVFFIVIFFASNSFARVHLVFISFEITETITSTKKIVLQEIFFRLRHWLGFSVVLPQPINQRHSAFYAQLILVFRQN